VTLAYLFSTEITFYAMFCRFVRKTLEKSKLLQWTAIGKVVKSFLTTPKLTHPHLGVENLINSRKNCILHYQMIELCCEVFPINNSKRRHCCCVCLEDKCEHTFLNRCILIQFTMISGQPFNDAYAVTFKQLYHTPLESVFITRSNSSQSVL